MPSRSISFSVRPPSVGLVTRSSSTSRSVRSLASASSSVATPFIGVSALAIATIRPGTRGSVGGRNTSSTPRVITSIRPGSTPKSLAMSRLELSETVRICWQPTGDLALHPQEGVPATHADLLAQRGVRQVDPPVEGDRVVDRGDEREAHPLDVEHPVADASGCRARRRSRRPASCSSRATRLLNVRGSGKRGGAHARGTPRRRPGRGTRAGRGIRNGSGSR